MMDEEDINDLMKMATPMMEKMGVPEQMAPLAVALVQIMTKAESGELANCPCETCQDLLVIVESAMRIRMIS